MRVWALIIAVGCGGATPPAKDQPGPQGTWTCKQIVDSCDSMCRTGMCLSACSNMGSQDGGSRHAALIQCAAVNRCYDGGCTQALCKPQVDACMEGGLPAIATAPTEEAPRSNAPPPPPIDRTPPPPVEDKQPPPPPVTPADPALSSDAIAGDWSYGNAKSGGSIKFASDGRFERETHAGSKSVTHDAGGWKLDGSSLVLTIAGGKPERRAVRMASKSELAITDDSGELQSYRKKR